MNACHSRADASLPPDARSAWPEVMSALTHVQHGVMVLDEAARVLFANAAAERIVRTGDGLALSPARRLCVTCPIQANRLHRLLGRVMQSGDAESAILVQRQGSQSPLALRVRSAQSVQEFRLQRRAVVLIFDPDRRVQLAPERLQELFGLTAAESAVAVRIMAGETLQTAADTLRVTLSTVRIHLQRVFEKTHTHRQTQLVRLLLQVGAVFGGDA